MNFTRTTVLLAALLLSACAAQPAYESNPYQTRAAELVAKYNAAHGTNVPVPVVHVGGLPNLDEGRAFCNPDRCYLVIAEAWILQRHAADYPMNNTLPHELAHVICITLKLCPVGVAGHDYHGPEWQAIARELGLDPNDSFLKN